MANTEASQFASTLHLLHEESAFPSLELPALNQLFQNGLIRGGISEIHGRRSSGRTAACLHVLAQATARGEICAVIDTHDNFHPASASAAGVRLDCLLWVRCRGNAESAIRAADLLLHAGGFGVVLLDLCETPERTLQRIPLSYWYRFRRAVEHTFTILLVCAVSAQAKSCSTSSLELKSKLFHWSGKASFLLLKGLLTSAFLRKPVTGRSESLSIRSVA